jgi:hypothetical protein
VRPNATVVKKFAAGILKGIPPPGFPNGGDPSVVKPLCRGFPTDFP